MSNALGPPAGPVSALESDSDPLCTNVLSAPSLFAKVELSASGALVVVIKKMLTSLNVVENALPNSASGRKASPVMSSGPDPNSVALYTCSYRSDDKPISNGKTLLLLPSTLVSALGDTIVAAMALELDARASRPDSPIVTHRVDSPTLVHALFVLWSISRSLSKLPVYYKQVPCQT